MNPAPTLRLASSSSGLVHRLNESGFPACGTRPDPLWLSDTDGPQCQRCARIGAPAPLKPPTYPVDCRYGAPMGRGSRGPAPAPEVRVSLRRVRLNSGGYDSGGAYWGHGAPLWWAGSDCGTVDMWFRARDRDAARAVVLRDHPGAVVRR